MLTTFESLNETGKKIAGFVFVCCLLWLCLIAQFVFSYLKHNKDMQVQELQIQKNATWVKPTVAEQEQKPKPKSYWSLKLSFEEGGEDE